MFTTSIITRAQSVTVSSVLCLKEFSFGEEIRLASERYMYQTDYAKFPGKLIVIINNVRNTHPGITRRKTLCRRNLLSNFARGVCRAVTTCMTEQFYGDWQELWENSGIFPGKEFMEYMFIFTKKLLVSCRTVVDGILLYLFLCICYDFSYTFPYLLHRCLWIRPKSEMECDHSKTKKVFLSQILEPIKDSFCVLLFFLPACMCALVSFPSSTQLVNAVILLWWTRVGHTESDRMDHWGFESIALLWFIDVPKMICLDICWCSLSQASPLPS